MPRDKKNSVKEAEVHPNAIIRKKIKSKTKLGKMLLEIYDEVVAGVYPTINHTQRLKKFGIHQYTWDDAFGDITKKDGENVVVEITEELRQLIEMTQ